MGKRIGYARFEAILERLKREINFGEGTTFSGQRPKVTTLSTGADGTDIGGHIRQGGNSVIEITNATSCIGFDSSDGAVTVGDYLDIYCDGTDFYCIGTTVTAATIDIADAADGHTLP